MTSKIDADLIGNNYVNNDNDALLSVNNWSSISMKDKTVKIVVIVAVILSVMLIVLLSVLLTLPGQSGKNLQSDTSITPSTTTYAQAYNASSMEKCIAGKFGNQSTQLPSTTWIPPGTNYNIPLYSTQDLRTMNKGKRDKIHSVMIMQHGNSGNANDYYCYAINSLLDVNVSESLFHSTLIIATYFPQIGNTKKHPYITSNILNYIRILHRIYYLSYFSSFFPV